MLFLNRVLPLNRVFDSIESSHSGANAHVDADLIVFTHKVPFFSSALAFLRALIHGRTCQAGMRMNCPPYPAQRGAPDARVQAPSDLPFATPVLFGSKLPLKWKLMFHRVRFDRSRECSIVAAPPDDPISGAPARVGGGRIKQAVQFLP